MRGRESLVQETAQKAQGRKGLGTFQEMKHSQNRGAPQAGRHGGRWAARAAGVILAGPCGSDQEFGLSLEDRGSHQSV